MRTALPSEQTFVRRGLQSPLQSGGVQIVRSRWPPRGSWEELRDAGQRQGTERENTLKNISGSGTPESHEVPSLYKLRESLRRRSQGTGRLGREGTEVAGEAHRCRGGPAAGGAPGRAGAAPAGERRADRQTLKRNTRGRSDIRGTRQQQPGYPGRSSRPALRTGRLPGPRRSAHSARWLEPALREAPAHLTAGDGLDSLQQ